MKEFILKNFSESENIGWSLNLHVALSKLITDSDYKYAFRVSYRKILLVKKTQENIENISINCV